MSKRPFNFRIEDSHFACVVKRPVAILMVTLAVAVFGIVSLDRLALTLMPDMSYPTLTVRTSYPGTAPEEIENVISRPVEQALGIIPKLVTISSVSKAGLSDVVLEFQWKTDMDLVAQEVREKIDRLRFPEGAQRPLLLHYDPSLDPILRVGLAGPQSLYELRHLAEHDVKRKIEAIPGVAAVQIKGGLEEQFLVALDEARLSNLRLDISQIATRLQQGNVNMPGGNLREGQTEYLIRTLNEFRTIEEIGSVIIGRQNNVDIRLRDIATVTRFHEDRQVITRVNGQESVEIEIFKEADANVLAVSAAVKDALFGTAEQQAYVAGMNKPASVPAPPAPEAKKADATKKGAPNNAAEMLRQRELAAEVMKRRQMTDFLSFNLPRGATLQLLSDQSVFIGNSIREVQENALYGGLIAIAVLYLFLRNVVQTLIVSLCIPISILATFAPMYMADVSLNIISLGGLALGVGNLVDNAIVVLESIFRCREEGDDPVTAVVRGTSEVAMPVVASTLTTVAVFFPIVFVEGVAGQVFGDMALTVVFSQIASLIAALYLIPMLASLVASLGLMGGGVGETKPPFNSPALAKGGLSFLRPTANGYLRFPSVSPAPATPMARMAGAGRHVVVLAGLAIGRLGSGLLVILAAVLKPVWLWLIVAAFIPAYVPALVKMMSAPIWVGIGCGITALIAIFLALLWHFSPDSLAWAKADRLGPIRSDWVWPGMLQFRAIENVATGLANSAHWLFGRFRRVLFFLIVPAIALGGLLLALKFNPPAGPTAPPPGGAVVFFGGMGPGPASVPIHKATWKWLHEQYQQSWWILVLIFVPGILPFVFVLVRFIAETVFRILATVLQTAFLMVAQLLVALGKMVAATIGPLSDLLLGWFEWGNTRLQTSYPTFLQSTLRHRFAVLGGALAALVLTVVLVVPRLGSDLIPQVHQGEFNLDVTLPIGTPIERTAETADRIDRFVLQQPEVERTALTIGAEEGASTAIEAGEHTARLMVRAKPNTGAEGEKTLIDRVRAEFSNVPEVKLEVSYPALFSFKNPIEVEIRGYDLTTLKRLSREAEALLTSSVPGLVDVRSTLQTGHPEIQVVYNRDRLAEYGLNLRNVAELVRNKVQGRAATQFRNEDQLIDIVVRLREQDRFGLEELRRLVVNPGGAIPIPLSAIAELTVNEGPSEIRRVDQQRTALITANIRDADLATVSRGIAAAMESIEYPAGFAYVLAGQNQEMRTSLNSLLLAFGLAVFLVYIVMASQFESLVQPFLIMMTVPLAMIGVALVLWLAAIPITIMVFLGLIILVGIVVNNAIVLIDYINTLRGGGVPKTQAIIEAGRARLRPILMTALTTVVGLIPMALGLGEGAEIRTPMAITVIVGLSTATILTLVVIPTLYYQFTSDRAPSMPGESSMQPVPEAEPMAK